MGHHQRAVIGHATAIAVGAGIAAGDRQASNGRRGVAVNREHSAELVPVDGQQIRPWSSQRDGTVDGQLAFAERDPAGRGLQAKRGGKRDLVCPWVVRIVRGHGERIPERRHAVRQVDWAIGQRVYGDHRQHGSLFQRLDSQRPAFGGPIGFDAASLARGAFPLEQVRQEVLPLASHCSLHQQENVRMVHLPLESHPIGVATGNRRSTELPRLSQPRKR